MARDVSALVGAVAYPTTFLQKFGRHVPCIVKTYPTPTLALLLKGKEITTFLTLQGGGQEGDGLSVGVIRNDIVFMKRAT